MSKQVAITQLGAAERVEETMNPETMLTNIGKRAINAPWR
jgi:hypothetical protein